MTDRARHWRGLVEAWETSGRSQAEFCRRRGVKAVTFGGWKRRLNEARTPTGGFRGGGGALKARGSAKIVEHEAAQFVEVSLPQTAPAIESTSSATPGCYETVSHSGRVIRHPKLNWKCQVETLHELLIRYGPQRTLGAVERVLLHGTLHVEAITWILDEEVA